MRNNVGADKTVILTYEFKFVKPGKYYQIHTVYHFPVSLIIFNLLFVYRISSHKPRASNKRHSLINADPLGIHTEIRAYL